MLPRVQYLADATPAFGIRLDDASFATCTPRRRGRGGTPLGPIEGMVFSRIDDERSVTDIAAMVGLTPREVFHVTSRLVDLRIVEIVFELDDFT